jgi:hypothetical protein
MWGLVSLLVSLLALSWMMGFWDDPEHAMERIGRLGAALRRGYRGETPPPPAGEG